MIKELKNENIKDNIILKMIELNEIENLLKFKIYKNNIEFNIDGKISLEQKFKGQVNDKYFLEIFYKILDALSKLEKYMITSNNIYLNRKEIYLDQDNNVFFMVDLVGKSESDIKDIYQYFMVNVNFDIKNNLNELFRINTYLNSEYYTVNGFKNILEEILKIDEGISHNESEKEKEDKIDKKLIKKNRIFEGISSYIKKFDKKIWQNKKTNVI